jgi:D-3-phosphoglycerate dehydrogenase / 2-oxoglutarate reductase
MMNFLVISDLYVKKEVIDYEINNILGDKYNINFDYITYDWATNPFQNDDEIKEYYGSVEEIIKRIRDIDVLLVHCAPVNKEVLNNAKNLKAIGVFRGGPLNVNVNAATEKGIPVFNAPGRNAGSVVEFEIGLIITVLRRIIELSNDMKKGKWRYDIYKYDNCSFALSSKVVGIVGLGNIGKKFSLMLSNFGADIYAYDPYVDEATMKKYKAKKVNKIEDLLKLSDIVTIKSRLTPETRNIADLNFFKNMKKDALFVNTARGGLVNYKDLCFALKNNLIKHAAIDVYDAEPMQEDNPLLQLNNVTLTPHIAGVDKDSAHNGVRMVVDDIRNFLDGKTTTNCLNPEVFN